MNKYEWIEGVMASKMKQPVKVFAFGLFKHMNGETKCYPGDEALMEVTGMGRGHFTEYRKTLVEEGWVSMATRRTKNGNSYTYTASMPPAVAVCIDENATNGAQNATNGEQSATNGAQNATSGGRNTLSNTTSNTGKNTNSVPPAAVAPGVTPKKSKKKGSSLKEKSKKTLDSLKQERDSEDEKGRRHLENRLNKEPWLDKELARSFFDNKEWRPDAKGVHRAAVACLKATPDKGPVEEPVVQERVAW